jgi:hypothetical protein
MDDVVEEGTEADVMLVSRLVDGAVLVRFELEVVDLAWSPVAVCVTIAAST